MSNESINLEEMTKEILNDCDELLDLSVKSCGYGSVFDVLEKHDENDVNLMVKTVKLYSKTKKFSIASAKMMDDMNMKLQRLEKMNQELVQQNNKMLDQLSRLIKKD